MPQHLRVLLPSSAQTAIPCDERSETGVDILYPCCRLPAQTCHRQLCRRETATVWDGVLPSHHRAGCMDDDSSAGRAVASSSGSRRRRNPPRRAHGGRRPYRRRKGPPQSRETLWGEEAQGSGRSFRRQAETEASGLCDDEVVSKCALRGEKREGPRLPGDPPAYKIGSLPLL